jgi:hypothetical protein
MHHLNNYIDRTRSVITNNDDLEPLKTFKEFPVFMGCVDTPAEEDIVADMEWVIEPATGMTQLRRLLPLDILYLHQHNDGTGTVWKALYDTTASFIFKHSKGNRILEIGGAHDELAERYFALDSRAAWTIVEPNPQHIKNPRVRVIQDWFDDRFKLGDDVDMVVHSHVFEHTYNPLAFLRHVAEFLKPGQRHIFAFPNLQPMLERKFTNALNFEHTAFLTEAFTDWMLRATGFEIIAKEHYGDPHSILYATEKTSQLPKPLPLTNMYTEYKRIFLDFVRYHEDLVRDLNAAIASAKEPIYIFGAHIFAIYLLNFGLDSQRIVSVLDNSPLKQGKRLYGTNLRAQSPTVLRDKGRVNVILKAGAYNEEIKQQIISAINPQVVFW